jgi:hypothetical protein
LIKLWPKLGGYRIEDDRIIDEYGAEVSVVSMSQVLIVVLSPERMHRRQRRRKYAQAGKKRL